MNKKPLMDSKHLFYLIVTIVLCLLAYIATMDTYHFAKDRDRLDLEISDEERIVIIVLSIGWILFSVFITKMKSYAWGTGIILGGITYFYLSLIFFEGWTAAVGLGGLLFGCIGGIILLVINYFIKK